MQSLGQKANIVVSEVGHTCTTGRGRIVDFAVISDSLQPREGFFYDIYGIGNVKRVFFSHVARHPADFDGRPTAGAQVLVRVTMIP